MLSVTAWSRKSVLNLTNYAGLRGIPVGRFWEQTKCLPLYRSFGSFEKDKHSAKTGSPSLQFLRGIGHASNKPGNNRRNYEKVSLSARGGFALAAIGALLLFVHWLDPINHDVQHVTQKLDDVKGVDEVKREMKQLVEFLRDPKKYASFGVKLPKVVLLVGEPGTGKQLLGRAVAGEAQVPYLYLNGPELAEMEIGLALCRVKRVYESAKAHPPCVLMVHKIDSVGCKTASSGKRPFVNHIRNQLLAEIKKIGENEGVLTIASTTPEGKDCLDKEFLRAGAGGLSIVVEVPLPDVKGRKEIVEKYLDKAECGCDVPLEKIARETLGLTGGQLEEMMEEARVRACTGDAGCKSLAKMDVNYGRKRIIENCHQKGIQILSEAEKLTLAHHEAGHALMALLTKGETRLEKVTIIPNHHRDYNGLTSYLPETTGNHTRSQKVSFMLIALGGKAAEALLLGGDDKVTAGVRRDMQTVNRFGHTVVRMTRNSSSLGLQSSTKYSYILEQIGDSAEGTTGLIDKEVKKLVDELYSRTKIILYKHSTQLKALADALLKYETLDAERVKQIIAECDYERKDLMLNESQNGNDIV